MDKENLFSDREWTEIARGYRASRWLGKARVWLLVGCAVTIATGTVISIIWIVGAALTAKPPAVVEAPAAPTHAAEHDKGGNYVIDNLSISFGNRRNTYVSFAQFSVVVQCPTAACLQWMKLNRASLRDGIYTVAMRMNVEDLRTTPGVESFKKALFEEFKQRFKAHPPSGVLIHDWFMH